MSRRVSSRSARRWAQPSRSPSVQLGMVGLGRMGAGMSQRLLQGGHQVAVYDRSPAAMQALAGKGAVFKQIEPIFKTLAPPGGYAYVGPAGAGHYSKMVHNGIEYSLMQGYAEGFEILKASPYDFDLHRLAALWNHGSVIRSWLL